MADDYCNAAVFRNKGFWGAQKWIYATWSGRFSSTALIGTSTALGPHLIPFLPAMLMVGWLAATFWSMREILWALDWRRDVLSIAAASELIVLAALASAPDLGQSLYWQTGALTYLTPVILWTLCCGVAASAIRRRAQTGTRLMNILLPLLTFVAAGTSETAATTQVIVFTVFAVLLAIHPKSRTSLSKLVWAGFAGSVLGAIAVASSPGNVVREAALRQLNGGPLPPFVILGVAVARVAILTMSLVRRSWMLILSVSLILAPQFPVNRSAEGRRRVFRLSGCALATSFLAVVGSALPAVFALGLPPPERSLFPGSWILLCASVLVVSAIIARVVSFRGYKRQPLRGALVGLGLGGLLFSVSAIGLHIGHSVDGLRRQAAAWDSRDTHIRNERIRGNVDVILAPIETHWSSIDSAPLESAGADTEAWVNECVADYYSIRTVVTRRGADQAP